MHAFMSRFVARPAPAWLWSVVTASMILAPAIHAQASSSSGGTANMPPRRSAPPSRAAPTDVITAADIAAQPRPRMSDILARVSGLRVMPAGNTGWAVASARATRPTAFASSALGGLHANRPAACFVQFRIDGARATSPGDSEPFNVNQILPASVERIEVYLNTATAPVGFNTRDAECGIIVIQTRGRPVPHS